MSETILYDGAVRLRFDAKKHSYVVNEGGQEFQVPSVTQITKIIDKSGPLMQWAANQAVDCIEEKLSPFGVLSGESSDLATEVFKEARSAFRRKSDDAIDVGKEAHSWIEAYLKMRAPRAPMEMLPEDERARTACLSALGWMDDYSFVPVCTELKLYSRMYKYAGTLDCVGRVDGELCIVDWKTSNGIYPEYRLQTAAYQHAYQEMSCEHIAARWIVRIGKDGSLESECYGRDSYFEDFEAFISAKYLWTWMQQIKPRRDNDVARSIEDCSTDDGFVCGSGDSGDHRAESVAGA